jgi:DNA replicative helicase MCM subunit Mcm2 (Cdc46/Mcm family)
MRERAGRVQVGSGGVGGGNGGPSRPGLRRDGWPDTLAVQFWRCLGRRLRREAGRLAHAEAPARRIRNRRSHSNASPAASLHPHPPTTPPSPSLTPPPKKKHTRTQQDDIPREFWVSFTGLPHVDRLRALTTAKIGRLTAFAGTVTRTSEVRPELFAGAFRCLECGATVRGVAQHFKRTEPLVCPVPACGNRKVRE